MNRNLLKQLLEWKETTDRLPLLLRGARQVGKTFLVSYLGDHYFESFIAINFEESPEFINCFSSLKPLDIISAIEVLAQQTIRPGRTLLFLDEIQLCPRAIMALRYFKEQLPVLHVIGAGSLLEFALRKQDLHMPVGRVQYLYLKPLSFDEYLQNADQQTLRSFLSSIQEVRPIPPAIHEHALKLTRNYMIIGGMPAVNIQYSKEAWLGCQRHQTLLLKTYRDDFLKYSTTAQHKYLQYVYEKAPELMGEQIKYSAIHAETQSRFLKQAITDLGAAGVMCPIYATLAKTLPLSAHKIDKKFKLLFLDIGLAMRSMKIDISVLLAEELMLSTRGALAEQFVGQELIAYSDPYEEPELYFWTREQKNSSAEIDYLITVDQHIIPVEVKSGKTGRLKSLHLCLQENNLPLGVRISESPLAFENNILSVPFYLIQYLPQLVRSVLQQ